MAFKIKDGIRIGTTDVFNNSGVLQVTAPKASNLTGGVGGSIPYQSAVDTTAMLSNGNAGQFLKSQGTTLAPIWADIPASTTITADNSASTFYLIFTATTSGALSSASVDNATTPLSYVPSTSTLTASVFSGSLSGNASTATKATNLTGGNSTTLLGAIHYQSDVDVSSVLSPNTTTTKKFLRQTGTGTNGAAPAWDTLVDGDIPSTLTGKTYNGLTLTAASTGFTIAGGTTSKTLTVNNSIGISGTDGKTLTLSNSLTFTGTDSSSVAFGTGGTVAYTGGKLSQFSSTTSAELAGVISDETAYSSGAILVFNKAPTFDTSLDGSATFGAFASSTTLTLGYTGTSASTTNISTGAVAGSTTKTINIGTGGTASSTTNINLGSSNGGTVTVNKDLVVTGDLTINGTTTTVNSTTIAVDDKNIELGSVAVPSNTTADGGGITLKGATDKTFNWINSTSSWTSSEHLDLASGKAYYINGTSVLTNNTLGSGIVNSSLTKVGALSSGTAGFVKVDASGNLTSDATTYLTAASTLDASKLSGTIPTAVLGNSSLYIGTTSVALNRASANLALTGILSTTFVGATSGTIQLIPTATAGTTTITMPATTGTMALTSDIANGTLGATSSTAGSTNTGVEVSFSGSYSANSSSNITIKNVVGPAISGLVSTMTGAGSGFLKKTAQDTYSVDTNTYLTAESDTLQTVTGRGTTTTNNIQLNGSSLIYAPATTAKIWVTSLAPTTISVNTAVTIDSFATATYRSAKYTVQIVQGTKYQISEVNMIHDGTTVYSTEYSVLETNAGSPIPITFTAAIATGTLTVSATITDASSTNANLIIQRTLFAV